LFSVDIDPNKYVAETVYGQCSTSEQGIIMTLGLIPGITMTLDPIPGKKINEHYTESYSHCIIYKSYYNTLYMYVATCNQFLGIK
jgi:hypothetical protein